MAGFVPPPYPYDRLNELRAAAERLPGGCVNLSVGAPSDPPPAQAVQALQAGATDRGYPPSVGSAAYREAAEGWLQRRFGVRLDSHGALAACIGTKEFVASLPAYLHLRTPERDTVLYPEISYPTYAMGATLAGCRAVPVPLDAQQRLDVSAIDEVDAARALCLWSNTPGNPAGGLDDLGALADWGRAHGVPVFSDECYIEFTWGGPPASILAHGCEGVVAVHSLSKRSNAAGIRAGIYAGDAELVEYLSELRKHAGMMVPGPVQHAAVALLGDDAHVDRQRDIYLRRLQRLRDVFNLYVPDLQLPGGGFYLWVPAPDGDGWALARRVAADLGALVSPGEFYGPAGAGHVRVAAVAGEEQITLLEQRLGSLDTPPVPCAP